MRIDDPIAAQLMLLLDGSRNRPALARDLAAFCQSRGITIQTDGATISDLPTMRQFIAAGLESKLRQLARMAVLVA